MVSNLILLLFINYIYCAQINNNQLSIPRGYIAATSLNSRGLAFFAGGFDDSIPYKRVDIYNAYTNSWTNGDFLSIARFSMSAGSLDPFNLVFFAGGMDNSNNYPTIDIFNAQTQQWTTNALSQSRYYMSSSSLPNQGLIFFGGGSDGSTCYLLVDIYNANTLTMQSGNYLSKGRYSLASTSLNNQGLVFFGGGLDCNNNYDSTVDVYQYSTNSWIVTSLSVPRQLLTATTLQNQGLIFFAGGNNPNLCNQGDCNNIDIYNYNNQQWSSSSNIQLSTPRASLNSVSLQKYALSFFGSGDDSSGTINIYDYFTNNIFTINLLTVRNYIGVTSLENQNLVFFAGGRIGAGIPSGIVDIFGNCTNGYYLTINPSSCTICPSGSYCPQFNTQPITCSAGSFCPLGSTNQIPCPAGTYNPNSGSSLQQDCLICPAGNYCPLSSNNYYTCPLGRFCPIGSADASNLCPFGTYSLLTGLYSSSQCTPCNAGTYNNIPGSTSPTVCNPCAPGYYCPIGTSYQQPCEQNYYCPNPSVQLPCSSGTYNNDYYSTQVSSCNQCKPGYACPGNGESSAICLSGTYSSGYANSVCQICPEGYFCSVGATEPIICEKNYFSIKGSSSCTQCDNGQFTNGPGASTCFTCPSSKFSFDGWWCMTIFEKFVFIFVWIGSVTSGFITIYKIYQFINKRKKIIKDANFALTLRNFIHIEKVKKMASIQLTTFNDNENDVEPMIYKQQNNEIKNLKETMAKLQEQLSLLENRL